MGYTPPVIDEGMQPMQCPVCNGSATDITALDFDGSSVRCSRCEDYDIAGGYEAKLDQLPPEDRMRALQKAKSFAKPGARPCISGSCF